MRAEQGVPIATARHGDAGDGGGAARLREGLLGRLEEHGVAASAAVADAVVLVEAAGAVVVRRTASPPFAWRASISGGYTTGNLEPKAADQPVTVNVADDPAGPLVGERAQLALAGTARVVVVDRADPAVERVVAGAVGWVAGTDDGPEDAAVAAWSAVREVQPVTARAATKTAAVMDPDWSHGDSPRLSPSGISQLGLRSGPSLGLEPSRISVATAVCRILGAWIFR